MVILLLPLVAAIFVCDHFYPLRKPWQKTEPNATQTALYQRLADGGLSGDELATVGALTLGYKEDLNKALRRHFQASGAAHVLAVSGLHTGIIYVILGAISLAIIGTMWGYAWLTGMTPSVVRAVVMVSLYELGKILRRNSPTLNTIAAAAVLILLVRPSDLWSVSFQLSFAATFAIVIMANGEWARWRMPQVAKYVLGIIVVSLAAQLGTLPITMFYFKQVSCYFLLANLCVLPIATLLVPCGLISIALGGSVAGVYFSKITWSLAWLMNHSVAWIESLPGCTLPAHIDGTMVGVYYVLLLAFCFFFRKGIKA